MYKNPNQLKRLQGGYDGLYTGFEEVNWKVVTTPVTSF